MNPDVSAQWGILRRQLSAVKRLNDCKVGIDVDEFTAERLFGVFFIGKIQTEKEVEAAIGVDPGDVKDAQRRSAVTLLVIGAKAITSHGDIVKYLFDLIALHHLQGLVGDIDNQPRFRIGLGRRDAPQIYPQDQIQKCAGVGVPTH